VDVEIQPVFSVAEWPIAEEEDGETLLERLLQTETLGDVEVASLRQSLILLSKAGSLTRLTAAAR
jgi:hypothetical protein